MSIDRERIIEKIAKCMALSKSDNVNEAASALRQAQKLMEIHGISEKDITLTNIKELKFRVQKSLKRPPHWLTALGSVCAEAFSCEMYFSKEWEDGDIYRTFTFVGYKDFPELAKYCFDVLLRQLIDIANQYRKALIKEGDKCGLIKLNSFRLGWALEVGKKVKALRAEDNQDQLEDKSISNTIVLVKNTVSLYMEEKHPNIKIFKSKVETDTVAYMHGMIKGSQANLNVAMTNNHKPAGYIK